MQLPIGQITNEDSNKPSFWLLHFTGWLFYIIVFTLDNTLFAGVYNAMGISVLFPLILSGVWAAILTIPLRYLYQHCWGCSAVQMVRIMVLASVLVALLWTPVKNVIIWKFIENFDVFKAMAGEYEREFSPWMLLMSSSYSFFMVMVWSSLYFGINYHYRLLSEQQKHLKAVKLSHNAQIKMLRYQINPHFLFNTLNAISTLVLKGSKDKANGMLTRLSTFLRFSLDNDPEKKIRLYEELKALMLYLEIEKTRFDERLSVDFQVDPDTEGLRVPSLILQPLVENAIKYAIARMAVGGVIKICARRSNNLLHLEVADNGPNAEIALESPGGQSLEVKGGKGVGLRNIKERLTVLYPDNFHFQVKKNVPQGLSVVIQIPIEES